MFFMILLFAALAFIYDLLRSIYKSSKRQNELTEQLISQNEEIIKFLSDRGE